MTLGFIILGLLSYKPMTGYDLKTFFKQSIYFFWPAELSQIYRELGKLESMGFIDSQIIHQESRPDKKVYQITNEGEKAFIDWLNDFPQELLSTNRNEFLVRVFFSSKISQNDLARHLENYISQQEKELRNLQLIEEKLDTQIKDIKNCDLLYQRFTVRRGVLFSQTSITWAKECLESLK